MNPVMRICLIEQDKTSALMLTRHFRLEGLAFDWFRTGKDAIQAIKNRRYGLILAAIELPDMSGKALFKALKGEPQSLPPFILMAGKGSIDEAVLMIKRGVTDYLTKPIAIKVLTKKLKKLHDQEKDSGRNKVNTVKSRPNELTSGASAENLPETLATYLARWEREYIISILIQNQGAVVLSSTVLGISRKNLWEKMNKLNIKPEDYQ